MLIWLNYFFLSFNLAQDVVERREARDERQAQNILATSENCMRNTGKYSANPTFLPFPQRLSMSKSKDSPGWAGCVVTPGILRGNNVLNDLHAYLLGSCT